MSAPRWATWLLRHATPRDRVDDVIGDLEEAHRSRAERHGRIVAAVLTGLEALDVARAFLLAAVTRRASAFSLLDAKLALRMLLRYPGLTLVAGLSMAFAIWASASVFEFFQQIVRPRLPLDDGARIVTIVTWDPAQNRAGESRVARDIFASREEIGSIQDLGAYASADRNLSVGDAAHPLRIAAVTPSAFTLARVAPLHGRLLVEGDAERDAPPVVVLGHDVWRSRFAADPAVVGRTVRLGAQETTVVGIMPEGFAFPVNHEAWTPLRLEATMDGPGGNALFGRLAPGSTIEEARAELGVVVRRREVPAEAGPPLRVAVHRYGSLPTLVDANGSISVAGMNAGLLAGIAGFNLLPVLLLLLIAATVALLMFARAAAREAELAVRTALGASRRRIVGQLFLEALVLGALASVVGLAATGIGLRWLIGMVEAEVLDGQPAPFWIDDGLSAWTIGYAAALTMLGALVAGAGPALALTRGVGARMRQATAGGGGVKLGGVWTAVIVVQVAFTVAFPTVAVAVLREGMGLRDYEIAIRDEEFLGVQIRMDRQPAPGEAADTSVAAFAALYRERFDDLASRMRAEPGVLGVTWAERLPRTYHGWNQIEVDAVVAAPMDERGHRVARAVVDIDYFDALGAPVSQGRGFTLTDLDSGASVVLVDRPFVERVLGGANPIGRRVRYIASESFRVPTTEGPWYEIVGVAPDLGIRTGWGYGGIYHPTRPGSSYPLQLILHTRGDPEAMVPRLRAVAAAVDTRLRLHEPLPLDESTRLSEDAFYDFWTTLAFLVCGIALLISLAAIYSVTSFTVVRRTREIGVRVALGGRAPHVVGAVLKRPLMQVSAGIGLGLLITWGLRSLANGYGLGALATVASYGLLMAAVCATACIVPTRRALAVEPTQALQADG